MGQLLISPQLHDYDSIYADFPDEQSGGMSEYTAQGWGNSGEMVH